MTKLGAALVLCRTGVHPQTFCKLGPRTENIRSHIGHKMFFTVVITAHKLSVRFITHDADGDPGMEDEITPNINTRKQFTRGNMNMLSCKYGTTGGLLLQQQET